MRPALSASALLVWLLGRVAPVEGTPCSRGPVRVTATRAMETHLRAGAGAGPPEARSRHETRSQAL